MIKREDIAEGQEYVKDTQELLNQEVEILNKLSEQINDLSEKWEALCKKWKEKYNKDPNHTRLLLLNGLEVTLSASKQDAFVAQNRAFTIQQKIDEQNEMMKMTSEPPFDMIDMLKSFKDPTGRN